MNGINKFASLALLLLFFSLSGFAYSISVSISPKDKTVEMLQLYPDEVGELEVNVTNNGTEAVENLTVKISVDEPLVIMQDSITTSITSETIGLLEPGEVKFIFVRVKPKEFSLGNRFVYVNYGVETFTHFAATYAEIIESPLEVQARLEKSALDIGEGSKMLLSMKNRGSSPINNITAELVIPSGIVVKSSQLSINLLSPEEGLADKEFLFDVEPGVTGEKRILLVVSFEDQSGKHILEREFFVDIQNRGIVLYFIIIAVIVLILAALYLKRKPVKDKGPLERPELKELAGKEITQLPTKGREILK